MAWITVDVDLDLDEILGNCRQKDIKYIIECLVEDGYLNKEVLNTNKKTPSEDDWELKVEKLKKHKHQLTSEEESIIIKLADRLI